MCLFFYSSCCCFVFHLRVCVFGVLSITVIAFMTRTPSVQRHRIFFAKLSLSSHLFGRGFLCLQPTTKHFTISTEDFLKVHFARNILMKSKTVVIFKTRCKTLWEVNFMIKFTKLFI